MRQVRVAVGVGLFAASVAGAQPDRKIPAELIPPKGMCRILIDGVPTSQQPAPTDCKTAVRNRPANGKVIFGDDYEKKAEPKAQPVKPNSYGPSRGAPPPTVPLPSRPRVKPPEE